MSDQTAKQEQTPTQQIDSLVAQPHFAWRFGSYSDTILGIARRNPEVAQYAINAVMMAFDQHDDEGKSQACQLVWAIADDNPDVVTHAIDVLKSSEFNSEHILSLGVKFSQHRAYALDALKELKSFDVFSLVEQTEKKGVDRVSKALDLRGEFATAAGDDNEFKKALDVEVCRVICRTFPFSEEGLDDKVYTIPDGLREQWKAVLRRAEEEIPDCFRPGILTGLLESRLAVSEAIRPYKEALSSYKEALGSAFDSVPG